MRQSIQKMWSRLQNLCSLFDPGFFNPIVGDSRIEDYVNDFANHLEEAQKQQQELLAFYRHWESKRLETIKLVEELLENVKLIENICDVGKAAGAGIGATGTAVTLMYALKGVVSPFWMAVSIGGHVIKYGFVWAKVEEIFQTRKRLRAALESNQVLTSKLIDMGLKYEEIIKDTKGIIDRLSEMSRSNVGELIRKEINKVAISIRSDSSANPMRLVASVLVQVVQNIESFDFRRVGNAVNKYLADNPDVLTAGMTTMQVTRGVMAAVTTLDNVNILPDFILENICSMSALLSITVDVYDVAETVYRLLSGKATKTQSDVSKVLRMLRQEHEMLKSIPRQLTR